VTYPGWDDYKLLALGAGVIDTPSVAFVIERTAGKDYIADDRDHRRAVDAEREAAGSLARLE
jgi:hypothetical protein